MYQWKARNLIGENRNVAAENKKFTDGKQKLYQCDVLFIPMIQSKSGF